MHGIVNRRLTVIAVDSPYTTAPGITSSSPDGHLVTHEDCRQGRCSHTETGIKAAEQYSYAEKGKMIQHGNCRAATILQIKVSLILFKTSSLCMVPTSV